MGRGAGLSPSAMYPATPTRSQLLQPSSYVHIRALWARELRGPQATVLARTTAVRHPAPLDNASALTAGKLGVAALGPRQWITPHRRQVSKVYAVHIPHIFPPISTPENPFMAHATPAPEVGELGVELRVSAEHSSLLQVHALVYGHPDSRMKRWGASCLVGRRGVTDPPSPGVGRPPPL